MTAEEKTRNGHRVRTFPVAVSTTALALAWARQEDAPHGAVVVAEHEVRPVGRLGRIYEKDPNSTLACSIVTRPGLSAEEGDASWLLAGLLALRAVDALVPGRVGLWWPDALVDAESLAEIAPLKADIHLRPSHVAAAVMTFRFDLDELRLASSDRGDLLDALLSASEELASIDEGATLAGWYQPRCVLMDRRLKVALLPRGETRGIGTSVDRHARLVIESTTGMVEQVAVDEARSIEIVGEIAG